MDDWKKLEYSWECAPLNYRFLFLFLRDGTSYGPGLAKGVGKTMCVCGCYFCF